MEDRKISLITMGQANPIALKRTLDSFKGVVSEVVFGDLLIFPDDRELVKSYQSEYNLRIIPLPFNYIFHMGFSNVLNFLISNAKNDLCLYTNVSEIIEEDFGINKIVNDNQNCNSFYFSHRQEKHRWYRCNDRRFVQWSGLIHEETIGDIKPYHKPIYVMADTDKDSDSELKAAAANTIKEMVYWNQLMKIVDDPKQQQSTNDFWVNFAKEQYQSMVDRLAQKGKHYEAFKIGDFKMFMMDIYSSDYFKTTTFESSNSIEFQGSSKSL